MKRFAFLFAVATLGFTFAASASDSDPGGGDRRWYGGRMYDLPTAGASGLTPLYYRPTMRYYGNGFTVNYRYVPVYRQDSIYIGATAGSSNFRTEAFHIATEEIPAWGANSPRLTVKDTHAAAPRTAVTSIVRKPVGKGKGKAGTDATEAPAITPAGSTPAVQPKP